MAALRALPVRVPRKVFKLETKRRKDQHCCECYPALQEYPCANFQLKVIGCKQRSINCPKSSLDVFLRVTYSSAES